MKKIITLFVALLTTFAASDMKAQTNAWTMSIDGATYCLPKTGVRLTMLIEKKVYTPGDLALYARKYLRDSEVMLEPSTTYRIVSKKMDNYAEADTAKSYTAHIDQRHNIQQLQLTEFGTLRAINTEATKGTPAKPFQPQPQPQKLDPKKFLSQDILSAGSKMKMAELCAKEIYDIRESRSELTRGQADYMPKDGEQLRLMLKSLDEQEQALRQLFEGTVTTDTTEVVLSYMPMKEVNREVWFRFSKHYGLVDADDLSGEPYYISVEDLHQMPQPITEPQKKAPKDETGVWINLPGRVRFTLKDSNQQSMLMEYSAGQFGEVENLNEPLFSKKVQTRLVLNEMNGGIEMIDSAPIK